ncbi:methionine--tRNA ligase subunit beta [Patescibacteria group bacterium]|nr:methionine--tRNA ligase subunit beta [Patescibacteria group bacterium]
MANDMDTISFDQFKQVEIRLGKILSCEKVEDADKLLKLGVDFGEKIGKRQIISGIAQWYTAEDLVGKKMPFVVNLEPRKLRGLESQGMIMAVDCEKPVLLLPQEDVPEGSEVV